MTEVERLTRVEKRAKEAEQTLEQLKKYVDVMMNSSGEYLCLIIFPLMSTLQCAPAGNSAIESTKVRKCIVCTVRRPLQASRTRIGRNTKLKRRKPQTRERS